MEPNNKYAQPIYYRDELVGQVKTFGYNARDVWKCILENSATHQATTYYLLEKDHERIC